VPAKVRFWLADRERWRPIEETAQDDHAQLSSLPVLVELKLPTKEQFLRNECIAVGKQARKKSRSTAKNVRIRAIIRTLAEDESFTLPHLPRNRVTK
jgi:hypothetical protein